MAHSWNNPYFHGTANATMPETCTNGFGADTETEFWVVFPCVLSRACLCTGFVFGKYSQNTAVFSVFSAGYCRYTDTADTDLQDGKTMLWATTQLETIQQRRNAKADQRPFFVGVGYHKPHMPEYCPSKYLLAISSTPTKTFV
jgi:hypothetical protein